jgi:hypothetical protein
MPGKSWHEFAADVRIEGTVIKERLTQATIFMGRLNSHLIYMHEKDVEYVDELDRLKFARHLRKSRNVHLDDGAVFKVVLASYA